MTNRRAVFWLLLWLPLFGWSVALFVEAVESGYSFGIGGYAGVALLSAIRAFRWGTAL